MGVSMKLTAEDRAHISEMERLSKCLPRRLEVLAMVRAGQITLKEGQRMIKKEEKAGG